MRLGVLAHLSEPNRPMELCRARLVSLGRGHGGRDSGRAEAPAAPNVLMRRRPPVSSSADNAGEAPRRPLLWAGLAPVRPRPATAPPTFFP